VSAHPASITRAVKTTTAHPTAVLAIICVSYFMVILDNSIIFTALPSIRTSMDLSDTGLAWVQDAYTLVFGGLILLGARSGDLLGRRRMFITALVLFATASFLVGAAPTGWLLIAARALQGIGAAILAPTSLALVTANFEGHERSRAVATYAATAGIGASAGLVVGGALADWISWRAGFFLNVPIAVAMILAGHRFLSETPRQNGRFDLPGALAATAGMGSVVFAIISAADVGWTAPRTVIGLVLGAALLLVLVFNEARAEQPIMPLRLFASLERSSAYAIRLLYLGAMIGFFYFTTQFFQDVLGWSPLQAGLGFLPMTAVNFAVALRVPALGRRFGNQALLITGVLSTLAGMAWLSRLTPDSTYLLGAVLPLVLIGVGQGLAFAPLTTFGITGVRGPDAGAASGLLNTAHQLGSALGLSILVTIAAATPGDDPQARATQVGNALTGGSVLLAGALIITVLLALRTRHGNAGTRAIRGSDAAPTAQHPESGTESRTLGADAH
jgi:EmrB/QacA subfamily drug resistance transporter